MTSQPLNLLSTTHRIALLVDTDNARACTLPEILRHLSALGEVTIRRAYGDWSREALKSWAAPLQTHAFRPIQQSAPVKGKNATDIALVIEAMELLFTQRPDAIAIASSDADFTPLALRLREYGVLIYGFGEAKTPQTFRNACCRFTQIGVPPAPEAEATHTLAGDPKLVALLRESVAAHGKDSCWASLSAVGSSLGKTKSINLKSYGCATYASLFKATGLFAIEKGADGQTYIADKRCKTRSQKP